MHDAVQIRAELDGILDLLLQADADFLQFPIQQRLHHLAAQCRQRLVHHPFHRSHLFEIAADLGAQFLLGLRDSGAAFLRQGEHFVLGQRVAFLAAQREQHVAGFAMHREIARFGKGFQPGVGLGFFLLVGFFDALALGLEILPVQILRNFGLQGLHHLRHGLAQQAPLPGGQAQRARAFRRIEVVQIAQVGRRRPACRRLLHRLPEQRRAAAADLAQHEQVVIRLIHAEAEAGGLLRALLPDPRQRMFQQFGSVVEPELIGIDSEAQLGGCQVRDRHDFFVQRALLFG